MGNDELLKYTHIKISKNNEKQIKKILEEEFVCNDYVILSPENFVMNPAVIDNFIKILDSIQKYGVFAFTSDVLTKYKSHNDDHLYETLSSGEHKFLILHKSIEIKSETPNFEEFKNKFSHLILHISHIGALIEEI